MVERGGPSRAMSLGTLAHLAVLESGEFERRVIKQVGEDAVPIGPQLVDQLQRMRASVMRHVNILKMPHDRHHRTTSPTGASGEPPEASHAE